MSNAKFLTKEDVLSVLNIIRKKKLSIPDGSGIVKEFEKNFSRYIGKKYCLAQSSGTSTLHAAFFAIGLKKGDEVLVPSYTWHTSVSPMLHLEAKPVFCEINPETLTISPVDIESKITRRTKAIVVVHLFGMPAQMDEIMEIAKKNHLFVIEDCAQALGTLYKGRKVGTFGDISCFSLQETKILSGGEGGVFCTDKKEFLYRALILGHHGRLKKLKRDYGKLSYTGLGFKYRPNTISIALANSRLKRIDNLIKTNFIIGKHLERLLDGIPGIKIIKKPSYCKFRGYYGFRFIYDEKAAGIPKSEFIEKLKKKGVPVSDETGRCNLLHKEHIFNKNKYFSQMEDQHSIPVTEEIHSKIILIDFPQNSDSHLVKKYCDSISKLINKPKKKTRALSQLRKTYFRTSISNPISFSSKFIIELTLDCNLNCRMCFQKQYREKGYDKQDIGLYELKEILYKIKPKQIILSGGEPLLRKDFFDILDILKKLKTNVQIITNGSLFTDDTIKKIKSYDNIRLITFSLDYFDSRKHDTLRGKKGTFDSVIQAIDKLKDKFRVQINTVLFEDNLEDVKSIIRTFSKKGILTMIMPNEFYSQQEIELSKKRLQKVFKRDFDIFVNQNNISKDSEKNLNANLQELRDFSKAYKNVLLLPTYLKKRDNVCYGDAGINGICESLPIKQMRIDNKGRMIICEKIRYEIGYPAYENVKDIWDSKEYLKFRKDYIKNGCLPICRRCSRFKAY